MNTVYLFRLWFGKVKTGLGTCRCLEILHTTQYSILILDTSASSLAWPIHFLPIVMHHMMFIPNRNYKHLLRGDCINLVIYLLHKRVY